MKVKEIMSSCPITLNLSNKIQELLKLYLKHTIGSVVIVDDNKRPFQIITLRDLPKIFFFQPPPENISELLKKLNKEQNQLITIFSENSLNTALYMMKQFNISHLPVVDKNRKLSGILSLKDIIKKFPEIVYIDPLTETHNRGYLNFLKTKLKRLKSPTAILMIDLDNFKNINDMYGHPTGDIVLKKVAQTLRNNIKTTDELIRYGGEEFVIIAYRCGFIESKNLGERLRKSIKKIKLKNMPEITITASIGIASYNPEKEISEIIEQADRAMYKAKKLGKDRVEFYNN
ncbi:GGDEF domain-containing protein [Thermodesulfovibrio sp. 3907-1M]|uniref:diguanylate cyclase n=1 Tax=Thermodesulfovibrio autotrophicus TaxID=3118333 RepID=A0AAU8GVQ9_9BACT